MNNSMAIMRVESLQPRAENKEEVMLPGTR